MNEFVNGHDSTAGSLRTKIWSDHTYTPRTSNWVVSIGPEYLRVAEIGIGWQGPWIEVTPPGWTGTNTSVYFTETHLLVTCRDSKRTLRTALDGLNSSFPIWEQGSFEWSVVQS